MNFNHHSLAMSANYRDREAIINVERNRRFEFGQLHPLTNKIVNMIQNSLSLGAKHRTLQLDASPILRSSRSTRRDESSVAKRRLRV